LSTETIVVGMKFRHYCYAARRLAALNWRDLLQRVRLRQFHSHQRRCLSRSPGEYSIGDFFPGHKAYLEQLMTVSGIQAAGPRIPDGWWGDGPFWETFVRHYPLESKRILTRADAVLSHRFLLFGWRELELPPPVDWSSTLNPKRPNEAWPKDHYLSIHFYHDAARPELDVKWCWELNRFQHLLHLGAAWRITGNEIYAATARDHIESWIDQVRYPFGVQWSSNLEVALRMLAWARCHVLCTGSPSWDAAFLTRFLPSLYVHAVHVEKELTIHHTLGNHLLGEACALLQIACLYEDFPLARRWVTKSRRIIERIVPKLILEDGVYAEQSTGYLKFVTEFLLPSLHGLQSAGQDFSPQLRERMAAAMRFTVAVASDLRSVPMIGDGDSGSAIGWCLADYWDYQWLVAACRILIPEARCEAMGRALPAETLLLTGSKGVAEYTRMRGEYEGRQDPDAPPEAFSEFRAGGYVVSSDSAVHLILDRGPLGLGPGYAHGHADGLSFILDVDSKPFITDPGTMVYNGPVDWRNYFRGSIAHNTVRIDGRDHSKPVDTFLWSGPIDIGSTDTRDGAGWRLVGGSAKRGKVVHHRSLVHFFSKGVLGLDTIEGRGEHDIQWHLHFHPRWSVTLETRHRVLAVGPDGTMHLAFFGFGKARFEILRGALDPMGGWYSAAYGMLESCCTLRITTRDRLPVQTVFTVQPPNTSFHVTTELREYLKIREWPLRNR